MAAAKRLGVQKVMIVDQMAAAKDIEVLRLPPYLCALNPIELLWGFEKVSIYSLQN